MATEQNLNSSDGMDFLDQTPTLTSGRSSDNSGALFTNHNRQKESHPNVKGRAMIGGVWYWVSGWTKLRPNSNERYVSTSYQVMSQEDVNKYIHGNNSTQNTQTNTQAAPPPAPMSTEQVAQEAMAESDSGDEVF